MRHSTLNGRALAATSILAAGALALSGCGGSTSDTAAEGGGGDEGIANEITIGAVTDLTGPVAYAGVGAVDGAEVAIEEINESAFLGDGVTISLDAVDAAGEIERASSEMTKMMGDQSISAIIGPAQSQQASAVAQLVERQQVPTLFTQAGSEGVVIGDWTFRATAPMETYYEAAMTWLDDEEYSDISVIYNATFPTFAQLGTDHVPTMADEHGMSILSSQEVQSSTQDFTNQAQAIADEDPEAVVMLLIAPQSVTFLDQVRKAGYDGQIVGTTVQAGGAVEGAEDAADGLVYPVDFSPAFEFESSQNFVTRFEEMHGETPTTYAADGYDAMWWIARAIKESGSSTREGVQQGLQAVAAEGFEGAGGPLTFDGNDMRVEGVVVQWNDGSESMAE